MKDSDPLDRARAQLFRWSDSFTRLPEILALAETQQLTRSQWLQLLGENWSSCDNIGLHLQALRQQLPPLGPVVEMMTAAELAYWQQLPDEITIYRGCGQINTDGACWSLSREVASGFPSLNRYQQSEALLVVATVRRENVLAVKLDRDEAEIITLRAKPLEVQMLASAPV
jgi:hypothetical protein